LPRTPMQFWLQVYAMSCTRSASRLVAMAADYADRPL
jgi:hypothetical protein